MMLPDGQLDETMQVGIPALLALIQPDPAEVRDWLTSDHHHVCRVLTFYVCVCRRLLRSAFVTALRCARNAPHGQSWLTLCAARSDPNCPREILESAAVAMK